MMRWMVRKMKITLQRWRLSERTSKNLQCPESSGVFWDYWSMKGSTMQQRPIITSTMV